MTHTRVESLLGTRDRKKVGNNTYLERREGGAVAVHYYDTDVVTYLPDGSLVLEDGGYRTYTTKDRMCRFSPVRVWQAMGNWFVGDWRTPTPYASGMRLVEGPDGWVPDEDSRQRAFEDLKEKAALRERVNRYVRDFVEAWVQGEVPDPGPGDCWYCYMFEDAFPGTEHLLSHMEEGYYVPSLLFRAIKARGYKNPSLIWHEWRTRPKDWADTIRRTLRRYLCTQLGLAR